VDIFELFGVAEDAPEAAKAHQAIDDLANAVGDLADLSREPDLRMLALAVQDILDAAGRGDAAIVAQHWMQYEASGRRRTKIEDAKSRAEKAYRTDLEAITAGWTPVPPTKASSLPWREPEAPTDPSRPGPGEPEP
jgi:hypothetical protein